MTPVPWPIVSRCSSLASFKRGHEPGDATGKFRSRHLGLLPLQLGDLASEVRLCPFLKLSLPLDSPWAREGATMEGQG